MFKYVLFVHCFGGKKSSLFSLLYLYYGKAVLSSSLFTPYSTRVYQKKSITMISAAYENNIAAVKGNRVRCYLELNQDLQISVLS